MPQGGSLTIETSNVCLDEAYVDRHMDAQLGEHVLLAISDTGVGMDENVQAHIFEPFFTTKEPGEGTGLGLATVFGIVKQTGGHIRVYSEVDQGTTFRIYLPAAEESEAAARSRPTAPLTSVTLRGTETILVVEDKADVRKLAANVLQSSGYTVLEAGDGLEALQVSEQHDGPIHLLFTDVVMPHMSGRELAQQLKPQRSEMQVLFMSGYANHAVLEHDVLEAHAIFLAKPFSVEELTRKVRAVLDAGKRLE
jgi:CheY-like chemotaxis protein